MQRDEFEQWLSAHPEVAGPIQAAGSGGTRQFDLLTSAATIVLMYPVVKYLLTHIGLPWLHELGRYSELQRTRVHRWIDEAYRDEGFDPDQAEAASDRLIAELESTTNGQARESWERLLALLKAGGDE